MAQPSDTFEQTFYNPKIVVFEDDDGELRSQFCATPDDDHVLFSYIVADLVRHIATLFRVPETEVLSWVLYELHNPIADTQQH